VEIYEQPQTSGAYAHRAVLHRGEALRLALGAARLEVPVSELLPPKR
jgi:hypothetical protein